MGPTWKQDKYILALTASNPESNAAVELDVQQDGEAVNEDAAGADEDARYY